MRALRSFDCKPKGSPMGPLLRAVNSVAESIKDEFPHVAVDTLASVAYIHAPSL
jgi:hypothetical protein